MFADLNERSREIFRHIVDAYVETGEPVGSRSISRRLGLDLSPATIRNVMADLEDLGLIASPHTSAGRLPTDLGLRLFVHGLLEIGDVGEEERRNLEAQCATAERSMSDVLSDATTALSGLTNSAGLVVAPKSDRPLKHIEFVHLSPGRALVVLVNQDGLVENRVLEIPAGMPPSALVEASNYLNSRIIGRTVSEIRKEVADEAQRQRDQLDSLTAKLVDAGLATYTDGGSGGTLIVKGQSRLLSDVTALDDLERVKTLFEVLETKDAMARLLEATGTADGVQIFIGAENNLFRNTGCSMVIAPYKNSQEHIVGAIGVIGPTRLNYARIIPMVDYTAKLIGRLLWDRKEQHTG
jgi:heat-inducible transcriptional repressor